MKINDLLLRLTKEKYLNRWIIFLIDLFLSVFSTVTSLALVSYILDWNYTDQIILTVFLASLFCSLPAFLFARPIKALFAIPPLLKPDASPCPLHWKWRPSCRFFCLRPAFFPFAVSCWEVWWISSSLFLSWRYSVLSWSRSIPLWWAALHPTGKTSFSYSGMKILLPPYWTIPFCVKTHPIRWKASSVSASVFPCASVCISLFHYRPRGIQPFGEPLQYQGDPLYGL